MSLKKEFVWGNYEYSLREFMCELSQNLPLVVKICQGYYSHDVCRTYTFSADEVCTIVLACDYMYVTGAMVAE